MCQIVSHFPSYQSGFIVAFSKYFSQGNNKFCDVKIKIFETETKAICRMKQINIAVTKIFLNNIKQVRAPVTATNLSLVQMYF